METEAVNVLLLPEWKEDLEDSESPTDLFIYHNEPGLLCEEWRASVVAMLHEHTAPLISEIYYWREQLVAAQNREKHTITITWEELDRVIAKARARERERCAKDAERYRWLRDPANQQREDDVCVSDSAFNTYFEDELDAVIDAVLAVKGAGHAE